MILRAQAGAGAGAGAPAAAAEATEKQIWVTTAVKLGGQVTILVTKRLIWDQTMHSGSSGQVVLVV